MLMHPEGSSLYAASLKGFALLNRSGKETLEGTRGRGWRRASRGRQAGTAGDGPCGRAGADASLPARAGAVRRRVSQWEADGHTGRKAEGKPSSSYFSQQCWRSGEVGESGEEHSSHELFCHVKICISAVVCPLSLLSCQSNVHKYPRRKDSYIWTIPTGWCHDPKEAECNSTRMSRKKSHLLKWKGTTAHEVWQH